ncbi:O-antigen ligase family protein [Fidelibacter multiformis]|uniref:O-antigen ligase family protein n=1 Tax=Fidelibacter multiformis TaxID=3377529 RepID=UPI0037DD751F
MIKSEPLENQTSLLKSKVIWFLVIIDLYAIMTACLPDIYPLGSVIGLISLFLLYFIPELGPALFLGGGFLFAFFLGANPAITVLILFITLLGAILYFLRREDDYKGIHNDYSVYFLILFTAVIVAGFFYTTNKVYASSKVYRYVVYNMVAFLIPILYFKDMLKIRRILDIIWYFNALLILISLYVIFLGGADLSIRFDLMGRVNPIWIARALGMGILISIDWFYRYKSRWIHFLLLLYIGFSVWIIILSGSRGPMLGTLVGIMIYIMYIKERTFWKRFGYILAALLLLGMIVLILPKDMLFNKFGSVRASLSVLQRIALWEEAIGQIVENPVLGRGTGGYQIFSAYFGKYPHNIFLEAGAEQGIPAMIILAVFLLRPLSLIPSLLKTHKRQIAVLFFAFWTNYMINAMVSGDITSNYLVWFFISSLIMLKQSVPRESV